MATKLLRHGEIIMKCRDMRTTQECSRDAMYGLKMHSLFQSLIGHGRASAMQNQQQMMAMSMQSRGPLSESTSAFTIPDETMMMDQ